MVNTRVSALMDDELDVHETEQTLAAFKQDAGLRREWAEFHLVGAAMRQERGLEVDITASVMAALADEPTVLSPSASPVRHRFHSVRPLLALAASAAGVAVVAWVALGPTGVTSGVPSEGPPLAKLNAPTSVANVAVPSLAVSEPRGKLRDYLVAHHAHAPTATMAEGTRYVRTVSVGQERP